MQPIRHVSSGAWIIGVLVAIGCGSESTTGPTAGIDAPAPSSTMDSKPTPAQTERLHLADRPVIARFVGRDATIVARSAAGGSSPTYAATDAHGNVTSDDRTLDQLKAQRSPLVDQIDGAIADVPVDYPDAGFTPYR
ncbi:MAG: hypothetical protein CMJ49_07965 [Planctomycetaceae bacterium]|nr:hypothetical protein [Planctomycetaceae bacterium]